MPKIAHIMLRSPFPTVTGEQIRNAAIVEALSAAGDVLVLALKGQGPAPAGLRFHLLGESHFEAVRMRVLFPGDAPTAQLAPALAQEIEATLAAFAPDCVVVEGVALLHVVELCRRLNFPVAVDMHNVESDNLRQKKQARPAPLGLWRRAVARTAIARAEEADRRALRLADQVWACSGRDQTLLEAFNEGKAPRLVANPIPDERAFDIPIEPARYEAARLAYVGHLGYWPNEATVHGLLSKTLPVVKASERPWSLTVAGRWASVGLARRCRRAGAMLLDSPPEIGGVLASSGYAPMPMRHGGGTRIKALEALAAGLVVCATAKAVEGLELVPGRHFVLEDDARAIGRRIVALTERPDDAAAIAEAGRAFVGDRYRRSVIRRQVADAVAELTRPAR